MLKTTKCTNIVIKAEKKLNDAYGDIVTVISDKLNRINLKRQRLETIRRH